MIRVFLAFFILISVGLAHASKNKNYPGRHFASLGEVPNCTATPKWSLNTYGYNVEIDMTKAVSAQSLSKSLASFSRITGLQNSPLAFYSEKENLGMIMIAKVNGSENAEAFKKDFATFVTSNLVKVWCNTPNEGI